MTRDNRPARVTRLAIKLLREEWTLKLKDADSRLEDAIRAAVQVRGDLLWLCGQEEAFLRELGASEEFLADVEPERAEWPEDDGGIQ